MMNRELSKAELLLQQQQPNSENSLKIKLKLNPNDLSSSTSTLIVDKKPPQQLQQTSKPKKEILSFAAGENIDEIKLDDYQIKKEEGKIDSGSQPPIRLVMKIPKVDKANLDAQATTSEAFKPIKLKIKTQDMVMIATSLGENTEIAACSPKEPDTPGTTTTTDDMNNNSDAEMNNEDDALMNELKNSYQDKDFSKLKFIIINSQQEAYYNCIFFI